MLYKYFRRKDCLPDPRRISFLGYLSMCNSVCKQIRQTRTKKWQISASIPASYTFPYKFFLQQATVTLCTVYINQLCQFLGIKSIKSIPRTLIDSVDTFRRPPLTPYVLSAFTVISDETRKYFAICICTGYYRVGHSPLLLYYELLVISISYLTID